MPDATSGPSNTTPVDRAPPTVPRTLARRFEAVVVVGDEAQRSAAVVDAVEALLDAGVAVAIVASTPAVPDRLTAARPHHPPLLLADRRAVELVRTGPAGAARTPGDRPPPDPAVLEAAGVTMLRLLGAAGVESSRVASDDRHAVVIDVVAEPGRDRSQPHERLGTVGLAELASAAARQAGLDDPRIRVADGRIEVALADERDAVARVLAELAREGIAPDDVAVLVDDDVAADVVVDADPSAVSPVVERLGAGADGVVAVLADQRRRRRERELPDPSPPPVWALVHDGCEPVQERARAALFTLGDGHIGIGGSTAVAVDACAPLVLAAGVYHDDGPATHLLPAPTLGTVGCDAPGVVDVRRVLDLRSGLVHESVTTPCGAVESVRFVTPARPGTVVRRTRSSRTLHRSPPLTAPDGGGVVEEADGDGVAVMRVLGSAGGIAAAAGEDCLDVGDVRVCDLVAAYDAGGEEAPSGSAAIARLREARDAGFDRLLDEHRAAWAERWADADVVVEGDDELQRSIRFALFHLLSSVAESGEAAVGARGLSGTGYRGHVFWDADTFVLPFLAATRPAAARAMLEYRVRRLPAAVERARAAGREGAWFPWESARRGDDVTPVSARDRTGKLVAIRTGLLEQHIVADVAWAAAQYVDWTGDEEFASGPGRRLLVATARFWASRVRVEPDGRGHVWGVVGPDEYHEPVDDNAFTNVMARWNLRRAADAVVCGDPAGLEGDPVVDEAERERWRRLADSLVDGFDPDTGVYEQFAGFSKLEPLIIEEVAPRRPIVADLLLGADRVRRSQVIKQADVLMLHHLVPDEVEPDSLDENLRFYEPRTAHGSSLSPAVHASLLARARDFDRALEALHIASRIDLDDLTETTASGLHLAAMGGLWQAMAFGFGGLRPVEDRLRIDPRLPPRWSALELRVRFRGARVTVRKERRMLTVHADAPVRVVVDGTVHTTGPDALRFGRQGRRWEVTA